MSDEKKIRVGVIFGGLSAEKEISLATGRYVYSLVDRQQYDPVPLYMAYSGKIYRLPDKLVIQNKTEDIESRLDDADEIEYEKLTDMVDVIFIALLGKYGEDGVIQGLLELLKVPYTGSGILASAVAMHKRLTKQLLASSGILVPKDVIAERAMWEDPKIKAELVNRIKDELGFPVVVKPTREGSSVGVSFADNEKSLDKAVAEAFKWDNEILVEEFIKGIEFMCVVLGNANPVAMNPTEVEFEGEIHTYESKYMPGKSKYHTPPRISEEMVAKVKEIVVSVYKTVGIKGYGRVDGFIVEDKIYVCEPHTGTIMVPSSYVFQQASRSEMKIGGEKGLGGKSAGLKSGKVKCGISPRGLITSILEFALEEHSQKKGTLQ